MVNQVSTKDHQGSEIQKFVTHPQQQEEVHCMPPGTTQGGQSRVQTERLWQDIEHMPLLGFMGGVL